MKIIRKVLPNKLNVSKYFSNMQNQDVLFFDIETTGFIHNKSILYLIGMIFYENDTWIFLQLFSEKKSDEIDILKSFFSICNNHKYFITFNGDTFDIPFIINKVIDLKISNQTINNLTNIDLYKIVKKYKIFFGLENLKQKTLESFLNIHRKDLYTGGELIDLFYHYLSTKDPILEYSLLLHNEEDLLGLFKLSEIMDYIHFASKISLITDKQITNWNIYEDTLTITLDLNTPVLFTKEIILKSWKIQLSKEANTVKIFIPIILDTLFFYLKDYKNYYYSIDTDEAIHKSVGKYLDPKKRIPANASNCYTKKKGIFFETYVILKEVPIFKATRNSKTSYAYLNNNELPSEIICENLKKIISK